MRYHHYPWTRDMIGVLFPILRCHSPYLAALQLSLHCGTTIRHVGLVRVPQTTLRNYGFILKLFIRLRWTEGGEERYIFPCFFFAIRRRSIVGSCCIAF